MLPFFVVFPESTATQPDGSHSSWRKGAAAYKEVHNMKIHNTNVHNGGSTTIQSTAEIRRRGPTP